MTTTPNRSLPHIAVDINGRFTNADRPAAERADAMQSLRDVFAGMPELSAFHDRLSGGPEFTEQELADARAVLAAPRKARQGRLL